jgi:UDP-N-acetyl-2-amino-2-deoxyglucuronate dehydrogenase
MGVAGFVAPRHLRAIAETGHRLVAAVDPHDSVGILDRYFPHARFFTEVERFDRFLELLRRRQDPDQITHLSVCSPNYLHDAHVRLALRVRAHAICEKPLVINPWNLDQLAELETEYERRVYTVLQLRLHETIAALKRDLDERARRERAEVTLTYVTRRGPWYHHSWKGAPEKSGGLATNIGIHFFDMLIWLFGPVTRSIVHLSRREKMAGALELEWARVRWFLSVDGADLPRACLADGRTAYRSIVVDGEELEFTGGFEDLHTRTYADVLSGDGFGIEDARPSIRLVHDIRHAEIESSLADAHPFLLG